MKQTFAAFLLLAAFACCMAEVFSSDQGGKPPNILFISVDDMNGWIQPFNDGSRRKPLIKTPNLQALADQGVAFLNAHTPVPICSPARASIMTGLYPRNRKTTIAQYDQHNRVFTNINTMTQHFREQGYTTFGIGKIGPSLKNPERHWDFYQAFDRSPSELKPAQALNGFNLPRNDPFDWGAVNYQYESMVDVRIAKQAISFLSRDYEKPFFLGVGFHFPHLPWYLPQPYLDKYPLDAIQLPHVIQDDLQDVSSAARRVAWKSPRLNAQGYENSDHSRVLRSGQWEKAIQAYMAATSFIDELVGEILATLSYTTHAQNTIIVVFSDNGFHLGEKQHWRKMSLWEEATRVPLIISHPAHLAPARVKSAVSLVDIYPSLLHLTGVPGPSYELDGKPLIPVMQNGGKEVGNVAISVWDGSVAIRNGQYRYILYGDDSEELYDHKKDPMEHLNLLRNPEQAQTHANLVMQFRRGMGHYERIAP